MSTLVVKDLVASVAGRTILRGISLEIKSGEVHAIMGPNGAGKSTLGGVLMGHPAYAVEGGSVTIDGVELLSLAPYERARAGLFLAPQDSIEVPGVRFESVLFEASRANSRIGDADSAAIAELLDREAISLGVPAGIVARALNVDASGGEKKRLETLQLVALHPLFAVLDELDSGLDVDALAQVAHRVRAEVVERGLGVLAITHYRRLLDVLKPDVVHVLAHGEIVETGGAELAEKLEATGYAEYQEVDEAKDNVPADFPF